MTKLEALIEYGFPRGIGNTTAMIKGYQHTPNALVLVANSQQGVSLGLKRGDFITIDCIPEALRGMNRPLLVDHHALAMLVRENNLILAEVGDRRKLYKRKTK